NFNAGATVSALGSTVFISVGNLNLNSGASYPATLGLTTLTLSGGTANFSSGAAIHTATLTQSAGTLTGSDTVTVSGLTTWYGGTMSGTGVTTAQGGLQLGQADTSTHNEILDTRTFNNAGAASWVGSSGSFIQNSICTFNNLLGATLDIQNSLTWSGGQ